MLISFSSNCIFEWFCFLIGFYYRLSTFFIIQKKITCLQKYKGDILKICSQSFKMKPFEYGTNPKMRSFQIIISSTSAIVSASRRSQMLGYKMCFFVNVDVLQMFSFLLLYISLITITVFSWSRGNGQFQCRTIKTEENFQQLL